MTGSPLSAQSTSWRSCRSRRRTREHCYALLIAPCNQEQEHRLHGMPMILLGKSRQLDRGSV